MNIKELRLKQNVKQRNIISHLNISTGCISQWENGKRQPRIEQLPKLAESLNCSIEDVVIALINTQKEGVGNGKRN